MKRVMVVTDFSPTSEVALPYAYSLADPDGEVHLIHVLEHQAQPGPLYAHYSPDNLNNPEDRAKAVADVEAHLKSLIPTGAKNKNITTVVGAPLHPHVPQGIVAEAKDRNVEAVVIGSHGRTGLAHLLMGSVTEQILRECNVPVLVVPRKK